MTPAAYVSRAEFIVGYARGKHVLDCGVMGATEAAPEDRIRLMPTQLHWRIAQVADATGIDLDAGLVAHASAAYPNLRLLAGNIETVAIADRYDLIIMGDLIEHLSNPGLALDALSALLEDGGELLITTPNAFGLPNYLRFLTGRFREGKDHALSFNQWTLEHLLRRHGFAPVRLYTCLDHQRGSRLFRMVGTPLLKAFPRLGGTLLVVCARDI